MNNVFIYEQMYTYLIDLCKEEEKPLTGQYLNL